MRGRIYWADLGYGDKPWLCVSNNARNQNLESFLAARITTTAKPKLASIVPLGPGDPVVGSVLCDDLVQLYRDEIKREGGAVTIATLSAVSTGLRSALAL